MRLNRECVLGRLLKQPLTPEPEGRTTPVDNRSSLLRPCVHKPLKKHMEEQRAQGSAPGTSLLGQMFCTVAAANLLTPVLPFHLSKTDLSAIAQVFQNIKAC